jgi:hypothetical protein
LWLKAKFFWRVTCLHTRHWANVAQNLSSDIPPVRWFTRAFLALSEMEGLTFSSPADTLVPNFRKLDKMATHTPSIPSNDDICHQLKQAISTPKGLVDIADGCEFLRLERVRYYQNTRLSSKWWGHMIRVLTTRPAHLKSQMNQRIKLLESDWKEGDS